MSRRSKGIMFTGLIREIGSVRKVTAASGGKTFEIHAAEVISDLGVGDSISVNGVCTTVTDKLPDGFRFTAAPETLKKTTLDHWRAGTKVNLERPLKIGNTLDGHWVLGHVDGTVRVSTRKTVGDSVLLTVDIPDDLAPEVVARGSVALDGVSLTVARLQGQHATVSLVPHTLANTTLADRKVGDSLNIETDILGKHIIHFLKSHGKKSQITLDFLKDQGYI
jgi:riboflavin synthase